MTEIDRLKRNYMKLRARRMAQGNSAKSASGSAVNGASPTGSPAAGAAMRPPMNGGAGAVPGISSAAIGAAMRSPMNGGAGAVPGIPSAAGIVPGIPSAAVAAMRPPMNGVGAMPGMSSAIGSAVRPPLNGAGAVPGIPSAVGSMMRPPMNGGAGAVPGIPTASSVASMRALGSGALPGGISPAGAGIGAKPTLNGGAGAVPLEDLLAGAPGASGELPLDLPMKDPIGERELIEANATLNKYKAGKANLERRVIACEQWWKMRHWQYLDAYGNPLDEKPASAWLFNCVISKHADGIDAFPEPNVRPREPGDREEARKLSSIIPVVLSQNGFGETYSNQLWQKLKQGTGIYGCFWDKDKLNGLGDIQISKIDVLSIYWEPGISDIQRSRNVFTTELVDVDLLREAYPDKLRDSSVTGQGFQPSKYFYDDSVDTSGKAVVIDWYYKKRVGGRRVLHYVKYVDNVVLYATENDPLMKDAGLYDHGMYPFVFDPLFPIEGSPCGYGYIDIGKNAQATIDRLNQAIEKNALMSSTPRFFKRGSGGVNEEEFLDWTKPIVHVTDGQLGENDLREIRLGSLNALSVEIMQAKVNELKETTGNRDANTGGTAPGVTAASAIAAMQEQAGKTSRASTMSAYRAYGRLIDMVIELIRQFYDQPREFRILGGSGAEQFVSFTNENIAPQPQEVAGEDMGMRLPVFDVDVSAQRMSSDTKVVQNELALQLYKMGVLEPGNADRSLALLDIMDFAHKDLIEDKVRKNGTMYGLLAKYMQMALALAAKAQDEQAVEMIAQNIAQTQRELRGASGAPSAPAAMPAMAAGAAGAAGAKRPEARNVREARARAQRATQPRG